MTTILTKKKDTAGAPAPGDLTNSAGGAELAVNTATKRLYTKDSGGNVVEIGTNPSSLDVPVVISGTTTDAALRVTQLGTGNALLVEDSANPDSTPFVISQSGQVVIGNTSAVATGGFTVAPFQIQALSSGLATSSTTAWNTGADVGSNILLARSAGTTVGDYTAVASGNTLGNLRFYGSDGTAFIEAAKITAAVDGATGTNDMPGRLVFSTTLDGASTPTERMRIDNAGRVGIGTGSLSNQRLRVQYNVTDATATSNAILADGTHTLTADNAVAYNNIDGQSALNQNGFNATISLPSGGSVRGHRGFVTVTGATGTVTAATGFLGDVRNTGAGILTNAAGFVTSFANSGGGTLTNTYGYYASSSTAGANNYGFYGDLASAANTYNLYMNGTANNYLAGNLLQGYTSALSFTGPAGTITPTIQAIAPASSLTQGISTTTHVSNANGPNIVLGKSRGTSASSPTIVSSGDISGNLIFSGYDGATYLPTAYIQSLVDATPGTGVMPGRLTFSTTSSTGTLTERMRIDSAGNVGIATTSATGYRLLLGGVSATATSGNAYGVANSVSIQSDVTATYRSFRSSISTQATAFTLTNLYHFDAGSATIGAGSSLTNQVGFFAQALTGATNNYGFYGSLASAANTYNLYMAGTANNYLAGSLGIGSTSVTNVSLRVSKNITGATTSYGMYNDGTVQSDVTTTAYGFRTNLNTQATAFTLGSLVHYGTQQGTIGATSAVTNQYGFIAGSDLTGATNNYGFFGNIASGTGRYNLYMAGTADNYMAGNLGIGTTASTSMLQVAGSSSVSAFKTPNIAEVNTISATAATGTINYDVTTQSVLYYTTNASGNFTVNFRGSSGTSLNTVMQTGESISATFLVTNGSTAYYNSAVTIDGNSVTPKWQGGTAPTSGNASSIDSYTYVIIKTGSAAFTVLASVTKFA